MRTLLFFPRVLVSIWQEFESRLRSVMQPCPRKGMRWLLSASLILSLVWASFALAQHPGIPTTGGNKHFLYLSIPPDISKEEVYRPSEPLKERLHQLATKQPALQNRSPLETGDLTEERTDGVVIFVDHAGWPILPDLDAATASRSRAAFAVENELTFTFDSPAFPWSAEELSNLNTILTDCYSIAKLVYGNPAFNIIVNMRKDPTISFAGLYFVSLNEMVVRNAFDADPICHEMIHAFRDDNLISLASYEEGMTRAAEVEVFNRLPSYPHFDRNHSFTYDKYYEALNKQVIGAQNGSFLIMSPAFLLLRYQLSGYAWAKALLENPNFLADFNKELYARTLSDPTTTAVESKLLDIAVNAQPTVEGKQFLTWYEQQGVFDTDPPKGYFLYQRINQFTIDYFFRDISGFESVQSNATVEWAVYDHQNTLLDFGSDVTSPLGFISFTPVLPFNHTGRIKVVANALSPVGTISDIAFRYAGDESGVFGIVADTNSGTITITPLDEPTPPVSLNVINGAFSAPSLAAAKGKFLAVFQDENRQTFIRQFTKDASSYFLLMEKAETRSATREVPIDIRPNSDANRINPNSSPNINVAILSRDGFDATTVDPNTIRFGSTGTEAAPVHVVLIDVDQDQRPDMVVRFHIQDTGIKCGDTVAFLRGQIPGGPSIIGSNPITTGGCRNLQ